MRVVLIGAVRSTEATLSRLLAHRLDVIAVLGYRSPDTSRVSGYVDLEPAARAAGIAFHAFRSVNDGTVIEWVRGLKADVLFVVGLSQLVSPELLACARLGAVGYHPTALPEGRGRAPIAWLVLERRAGASTFFELTPFADDGAVFVQEHFALEENDDAAVVECKVLESLGLALDRWLPRLKAGEWNPVPQRAETATYYGKRAPEDGLIEWRASAEEIDRLVKASTRPHPGAFTYCGSERLIVWRSRCERDLRIRGVRGRVLKADAEGAALVQTGEGLLWLLECELSDGRPFALRVGDKLGYDTDIELHDIILRLSRLEGRGS